MSLSPGSRIGTYEVLAKLGEGGMGEVYRARDTQLDRDVALKLLPEAFAGDSDRLARFAREAKTLAALNHPNIAAIYGLEQRALVMELVEGQDLSILIGHGALPVAECLAVARQIADALETAHEQNIIHRDLKPANVKVRADGVVKVLDFGLAKAMDPGGGSPANSGVTMTSPAMTAAGFILGTAAYMSPEQARGKAVDRRADIWAFGAVLYEMLAGRRLFAVKSETVSDMVAAVLRDDVDWSALPATTPPRLRQLIERCLDRDVKQRLRDIGEARIEIARIENDLSRPGATAREATRSSATAAAPPSRGTPATWWLATAALVVLAAAATWWITGRSAAPPSFWAAFTQLTDASGVETGPSLSPDGSSFAYSSAARGTWDIYVQRVGGRNPVLVAGDPAKDEVWPAFSPDGKQIAFNQGGGNGGIFIVGATGESVRRLTDFGANPAWSPDGQRIVFATEEVKSPYNTFTTSVLWTVDVNGTAPVKLDTSAATDGSDPRAKDAFQPAWSPSNKRIAFWSNISGQRDLQTVAATGGDRVRLMDDAPVDFSPVWSPDGKFLYFASDRGGSMGIWRIPIDESTGKATGAPEAVAGGVDVAMDLPRISADGNSIVFRAKTQAVNPAAIEFDPITERAGAVRLLQRRTGLLMPTDVSPDGKLIALNNLLDRQQDIFVMQPDGSGLARLTDDVARDWSPRFTRDGSAVVYFSNKAGSYDVWSINTDGSNRTRLTALARETAYAMAAPDGRLFTAVSGVGASYDIAIGGPPWPMTDKTATMIKAQSVGGGQFLPSFWTRNGQWLAGPIYMDSGTQRGYALYDVAKGTVRQLNDDAISGDVAWMPDLTRVIYFNASGRLVIQNINTLVKKEIAVVLPLPPDDQWSIAGSPDGKTIYYGAQQMEANIWRVERR